MYFIKRDKLNELLLKDEVYLSELQHNIEDEQKKKDAAHLILEACLKTLKKLETKLESIKRQEDEMIHEQNRLHAEISMAEIWIMYHEHKINYWMRNVPLDHEDHRVFLESIAYHQTTIHNHVEKQMDCRKQISEIDISIAMNKCHQKDTREEIEDATRSFLIAEKNHTEWVDIIEQKNQRFYEKNVDDVSNNYTLCQSLLVRHMESNDKKTKNEAENETNPIIIDEEYLLGKPENLYPARRLTKDFEDDKYRKSA